jgi:ring-1,2-phenylacetyl-CoA epoxidase subunit PaaC
MSFDNVYESLIEAGDERWAFGQSFDDPLSGMDTTVPDGVDAGELAADCLALADDALVASQRLQEWVTRGPELEEEVALANVGLDLLGQARLLLARHIAADGSGRSEDELAYLRNAAEFRNVRLAEFVADDFGALIACLTVFSAWRLALLSRLRHAADPALSAIAAKSIPEVTYHRDFAARWAVRLGDGTEYSRERMQAGVEAVWPLLAEPLAAEPGGSGLAEEVRGVLREVLETATLAVPTVAAADGGGRDGRHGPELAEMLAQMQSVARKDPEASW